MPDRLVTIATYTDPVEAALARNYLEAEGIPACLIDETTVATDWVLGNALGGIKLQVGSLHVERAEFLLAAQHEARSDDDSLERALQRTVAPEESAEEDREADEDRIPINQKAERAFRATILGVLFLPVQVYAAGLLVTLPFTEGKVSASRRWKVWVATLLNVPLMALILVPLICLLSYLIGPASETKVHWKQREFETAGFTASFPQLPQCDINPFVTGYGKGQSWFYEAPDERRSYSVAVFVYPPVLRDHDADEVLREEIQRISNLWNARVLREEWTIREGHPARDLHLELVKGESRSRALLAGHKLYIVSAAGSADALDGPEVDEFFRSFALR
jgi:hypothetical protein